MTRLLQLISLAVLALTCGNPSSKEPARAAKSPEPLSVVEKPEPESAEPATVESPEAVESPEPAESPEPVTTESADSAVAANIGLPKPKVDLKPSKKWPFYSWDRAQAYTFNLKRPGPGAKLRAYSGSQGWTQNPVEGPALTAAQSKKALGLLAKTQGQMIVSKCPFPRHGIVFFQNDIPVGSISVCFECGDIMVWPRYSQEPNWDDRKQKRFRKLLKAYDRVFPRWETYFESELGLPKDWTKLPGAVAL